MAIIESLNKLAEGLVNLLIPHTCALCNTMVPEKGLLCTSCWGRLKFINSPMCDICGVPFHEHVLDGAVCGACNANEPAFDSARCAILYDDNSRQLITGFKYEDKMYYINTLSKMLKIIAPLMKNMRLESSVIIPVPLYYGRLVRRKFNQAAVIASEFSKITGVPVMQSGLLRTKSTPHQFGLSRLKRNRNVQHAFIKNPAVDVSHRDIILVDDVITTGATANECAKILKNAGAMRVDVIAIARTPLE